MRKANLILWFAFFIIASKGLAQAKIEGSSHTISSPDGSFKFQFFQKELSENQKQMYYTVTFNDRPVILESKMGVLIENNLFESALGIENDEVELWCENLDLLGVDKRSVDESWEPLYGERSLVRNNYNELVIHFNKYGTHGDLEEGYAGTFYDKRRSYNMDVVVRVYNEGVAFRYYFPETANGLFLHIVGEQTSFTMPEGTMAYFERWAQGPYSYLPLMDWPDECERPLTLDLENGLYVALLEAQMTDYSRGKFVLDPEKTNTLRLSMYSSVDVTRPFYTPWRVIMAAE